jgi:methionine-rich copper-binding protein CopC
MSPRLLLCVFLAGALAMLGAPVARAHAFLDHAAPAVGSTLSAPPAEIRLWFTEAIEPVFSSIVVTDRSGRHVESGKAERDANDKTVLRVALSALGPGLYKVAWKVVSVDTHRTQGSFTFTIGAQ